MCQFLPRLFDLCFLLEDLLIRHADPAHQGLARVDEGRRVLLDVCLRGALAAGRVLGDVKVGGDAGQQLVVRDPGAGGSGVKMLLYRL